MPFAACAHFLIRLLRCLPRFRYAAPRFCLHAHGLTKLRLPIRYHYCNNARSRGCADALHAHFGLPAAATFAGSRNSGYCPPLPALLLLPLLPAVATRHAFSPDLRSVCRCLTFLTPSPVLAACTRFAAPRCRAGARRAPRRTRYNARDARRAFWFCARFYALLLHGLAYRVAR